MKQNPIEWHLETRQIKDLKPHPRNPRKMSKHDGQYLEKAINEDGLIDKPSVDLQGQIIGGHQRIQILKKMGVKEVQVWIPNRPLNDDEINRINLRLNRISGEFDYDIIANEWTDDQLLDGGFTKQEIHVQDIEELASEEKSKKKLKMCPECGHEF